MLKFSFTLPSILLDPHPQVLRSLKFLDIFHMHAWRCHC